MMNWWSENLIDEDGNEVVPPVLLANRDNDPIVQEWEAALELGDIPTPAQERAFQKSTRGAIKTAEIAGSIFNHKDDKKGHHDVFRYWWSVHVGTPFTFPDTSNNRFQSYCDAAAALILHKNDFIAFLEHLRINKKNSTLNHLETNLWNTLHCPSTMSELAVLAIYAETVSYPYMKAICTSGEKNMLDLGPLHSRVYNHIENIIDDPAILVGKNATYKSGSLDGKSYQNPAVVQTILESTTELPHFLELLIAFLRGAAGTWERFTSEFAPGGLIDKATTEEKDLAWLPATNDENEGALGSFRVLMRQQPQLTLLSHNALAMFFRNNTQAFMEAKFTEEEDYRYLHKLGREAGGDERKRQQELVAFRDKRQVEKTKCKEIRNRNAEEREAKLQGLSLMLQKSGVSELRGKALDLQVRKFKATGAPNLQGTLPTKVEDKRNAISEGIDLYLTGVWKPIGDVENYEDSSDEIEEEEDWVEMSEEEL